MACTEHLFGKLFQFTIPKRGSYPDLGIIFLSSLLVEIFLNQYGIELDVRLFEPPLYTAYNVADIQILPHRTGLMFIQRRSYPQCFLFVSAMKLIHNRKQHENLSALHPWRFRYAQAHQTNTSNKNYDSAWKF